jgi:hypothetical protein
MAATYPLEVVQAARFSKDNPNLKGDQLNAELKKYDWDDSVKSLTTFPEVLAMMDAKIDWTQKLGDAVLAQQKELLAAVQRLRAKAQAQGALKSGPEITVTSEAAPPAPPPTPGTVVVEQPAQTIVIQPTNPEVVQVPAYNPAVVYGAWPYPAYPPYPPYYPPGYAFGAAAMGFMAGAVVGGALWGGCNWGGGEVNINSSRQNNFTNNVNRTDVAAKRTERQGGSQSFKHNPENRKGTQYRDSGTQQRFNKGGDRQASQSRENFRGRAEQGRQDLGRGQGGAGDRGGAGQRGQGGAGDRGGAGGGLGGGDRGGGGGAFSGAGQGRDAQASSNRGQASRQSSSGNFGASRSAGGGAGARAGGSGGFSGGGGGGGGTRGGGGGGGGRGGGRR